MWMIPALPSLLWVIMLVGNFIIDSLVILGWSRIKKVSRPSEVWKKSIIRVWLFGFLCDILASAILLLIYYIVAGGILSAISAQELFRVEWGIGAVLYGFFGALIGLALIYRMDKRWAFRKTNLSAAQKKNLAFWLAILTAPYLMMINWYW